MGGTLAQDVRVADLSGLLCFPLGKMTQFSRVSSSTKRDNNTCILLSNQVIVIGARGQ